MRSCVYNIIICYKRLLAFGINFIATSNVTKTILQQTVHDQIMFTNCIEQTLAYKNLTSMQCLYDGVLVDPHSLVP